MGLLGKLFGLFGKKKEPRQHGQQQYRESKQSSELVFWLPDFTYAIPDEAIRNRFYQLFNSVYSELTQIVASEEFKVGVAKSFATQFALSIAEDIASCRSGEVPKHVRFHVTNPYINPHEILVEIVAPQQHEKLSYEQCLEHVYAMYKEAATQFIEKLKQAKKGW